MEREAVDNLGVALGMEVEGGSDKGEGGRGGGGEVGTVSHRGTYSRIGSGMDGAH